MCKRLHQASKRLPTITSRLPPPGNVQVTIYDIARKANVSIATVSRVLNDQPRVAAKTRERVLEVAADLGYQPHSFAQNLARRQSNLVSVVVPTMASHFFMEVLRGVQDGLAGSGHDILVHLARTPADAAAQLDRALRRGRSAGVLVVSAPPPDAFVERLRRSRAAVVLIDCQRNGFDSIAVDNVGGGEMAVDHLVEVGCRRIALVMASENTAPSRDRRTGYLRAIEKHGLAYDENLVRVCVGPEDGFTESAGYDAMSEILATTPRPDGVFATSDVQAIGALRAIETAGLGVPDDVRVIGYDDIPMLQYAGVSTMRQPMYRIGRLGAARLLAKIDDRNLPIDGSVYAPELVVRSTTVIDEGAWVA